MDIVKAILFPKEGHQGLHTLQDKWQGRLVPIWNPLAQFGSEDVRSPRRVCRYVWPSSISLPSGTPPSGRSPRIFRPASTASVHCKSSGEMAKSVAGSSLPHLSPWPPIDFYSLSPTDRLQGRAILGFNGLQRFLFFSLLESLHGHFERLIDPFDYVATRSICHWPTWPSVLVRAAKSIDNPPEIFRTLRCWFSTLLGIKNG